MITHAPDLVVDFEKGYSGDGGFASGSIFQHSPPSHSSDHCNNSILFITGSNIRQGEIRAQMQDIAPTVLAALAVEGGDMDGQVLPVFASDEQ
jgi:predicted AlkP superfamily phosphohydrolase/phosphomutase